MSTVSRSSLIFKSFSASSSRTAPSVAPARGGDAPPAAGRLVGAATERGVAFDCCDPWSLSASLAAARFAPYLGGRGEGVAGMRRRRSHGPCVRGRTWPSSSAASSVVSPPPASGSCTARPSPPSAAGSRAS
eukprot:scaffold38901_cov66-Phaeocystis_antarctica.AAC.2